MPSSATSRVLASGDRLMATPSASRTSAAPHADEAARFPCLTTRAPAAAATIAPMVEMLTVCAPSPPVPTRSTSGPGTLIGVACASIAWASPVTSPTVYPFIRSATPNPAIWTEVAAPSMISFIAHAASSEVSSSPLISALIRVGQAVREFMAAPPGRGGGLGGGGGARGRACGQGSFGGRGLDRAADSRPSGLGRQVLGTLAHQAGQALSERDRVDRVAGHSVGSGPGGQPSVIDPADDQQDRRAVVDLILGLAADAHPAGRLGLAVEHHDVCATCIKQAHQGRLGGHFNDLGVRNIRCRTAPDGQAHPRACVRVMAVHNDLHETGWYRPGGSADVRLRGVVIMTPWPPQP